MSLEPKAAFVQETAVVENSEVLGDGTRVWHHAHIRDGAVVGESCVLGKNVFVDSGAVVGDRVKVQNNVSIYNGVTIESDVFVGPSVVFTNDRVPRAFNTSWTISTTFIRVGASIGANATIVCGVSIGSYAMVAAGAVVTKDVRDHELVMGSPARPTGWVCRCGKLVSRSTVMPAAHELICTLCRENL